MRKRILSMFLVAVTSVSMLVGCGNETKQENTKQEESKQTSVSSEVKSSEKSEESKEEPVTVTWLMAEDEPEDSDMVLEDLNKKLVEAINVKLNIVWISGGEYNDRVRLASTSGEDYDIVFTSNWRNNFDENMSRGAFLEIGDLIDQYGQNILAKIHPALWDVATVKGGIYAIPNQQISAGQNAFYVQKDLAEKYNFTLTKTSTDDWRDLEPFLDEVLANEENMYGIDIQIGPGPSIYESVISGCYIRMDDDPSDGVEVLWHHLEGFYDMAELKAKGYLHPEYGIGGDMKVPLQNNQFAVLSSRGYPYGEVAVSNAQGEEYILCYKGEPYFSIEAGKDTMLAINVNSKNPEAAVKLIDALWGDEKLFNELLFGLEGVHYNKVGDQRVEVIEGSNWNLWKNDWAHGNQFNRWKVPGEADDIWDLVSEMNRTAKVSPLRGFSPDTSNLQAEIAQVKAVTAEYKNFNLREGWEDLIEERKEKLIAAGIEVIVEEMQRQVDEFLATK